MSEWSGLQKVAKRVGSTSLEEKGYTPSFITGEDEMASLDPKTDQEAKGILCGQLTFLKRTESEVTRDCDGAGVGF